MLLPDLFSGLPVATEERDLSLSLPMPLPDDLEAVEGAVEKRRWEYLVGRYCARVALGKLGVHGVKVPPGADRRPIWPPGIVGSITHTGTRSDGFCAVAIARSAELVGLGLDAELAEPLPGSIWPTVFTPRELEAISKHPVDIHGRLATLYFSAKESVYKALYPLTQKFLDFQDVDLELYLPARRFGANVRFPEAFSAQVGGRFAITSRLIVTAVPVETLQIRGLGLF